MVSKGQERQRAFHPLTLTQPTPGLCGETQDPCISTFDQAPLCLVADLGNLLISLGAARLF